MAGALTSSDVQHVQWKIDVFDVWNHPGVPMGNPLSFTGAPLDDLGASFGIIEATSGCLWAALVGQ